MLVSVLLQFPPKFIDIEDTLFTEYETSNFVQTYQGMLSNNLSKEEKIDKFKNILTLCEPFTSIERKKFICLLAYSILQTSFGCYLLQENEKYRKVVFEKYKEFMTEDDQEFVEALRILKI